MKTNKLFFLLNIIFLLTILYCNKCFAQKDTTKRDTIKKEYYEENQAKSDYYKRKEKYDYVTRAKIEELSMFKIGLTFSPFEFDVLGGPFIGYERKLRPDISVFANLAGSELLPRAALFTPIVNLTLGGRYYYNLPEKIWEGKSANNLSANYFSLQLTSYAFGRIIPIVEPLFGIQRRLGHLFYIDGNIGAAFGYGNRTELTINLDFGLGL